MGIAQISQNRHSIASKEVNVNEQKIKLLLPHKKKKVVTVEIASVSQPSIAKDIWVSWDVEGINSYSYPSLFTSIFSILYFLQKKKKKKFEKYIYLYNYNKMLLLFFNFSL